MRFEHVVEVYDSENDFIGECVKKDHTINGKIAGWCFRPADLGLISQESLEAIAKKLAELKANRE